MTRISRREFGTIALASLPLAATSSPARPTGVGGLRLGVATSSFREMPRVEGLDNLDDVVRALQALRVADIELAFANIEPAPPSVAPFMGGTPAYPRRIVLTPEEIASTNARARAALRTWRLRETASHFERVRGTFAAAGTTLHACALTFDDSFTDEEIDATFQHVKALGVRTVASPLTMRMAARIVPFAERHAVSVAVHNQVDGHAAGAIGTSELADVLRLSPAFALRLDVGNLTASGRNAMAEIGRHRARLSHVVIRDCLRNGTSQPFGEGDTPIVKIVNLLHASAPDVPALVEYDYIGLRSPVDEVAACMQYVAQSLE